MNRSKLNSDFFKTTFVLALFILSACSTSNVEIPTATLPVPTITKTSVPTSTVTPSPTATPVFEGFGLSTELVQALKAHTGLASSIIKDVDGQYTVTATVFSSDGQPITQSMYVIPSTLNEDLESKNKFGNTPTIQTEDGKKLYWMQELKGWFAVEISTDINKPVFVPFDQRVSATRVIIAEFNQPFSQEAVDHWNTSPGLVIAFQYLTANAKTGEFTKFASLQNFSTLYPDITVSSRPVQLIDAWFTTTLPDGTQFQFFPTKWLDPVNPRNPLGDEWKIIFVASGQEVMGDKNNREKYDDLLTQATTPGTRIMVYPIVAADNKFFNDTNGLITFFVAQPSLMKLLDLEGNNFGELPNPHSNYSEPYDYWFDHYFPTLSAQNHSFGVGLTKDNPDYKDNFFPPDIQMIVFPSLLILQ